MWSNPGPILETFNAPLGNAWSVIELAHSSVTVESGLLTLHNQAVKQGYTNAQITDYDYRSFAFRWKPPLRLIVEARASAMEGPLRGTAGFGFWNHPFSPDIEHVHRLRLPQAIWFFFGSPPNAMELAQGVPGSGWKAATIDAGRPLALAMTPLALPALLLMQMPPLRDVLYPPIQRALAIGEKLLDDTLLTETHAYTLEWLRDSARFFIDDQLAYETPFAPRGPCGFVAWIDNQYAIATPQGRFGSGVLPLPVPQTLWLSRIAIQSLERESHIP